LRGGWCSSKVVGTYGVSALKHIRKGGILFISLCDLRWGMGLIYCFGMIVGVEILCESFVI
jgi:hypothetical protein